VLTGWGSIPAALRAFRAGAVDFLTKPATADQVVAALLAEPAGEPPELPVPSLDQVEWEHIQRVLSDSGGNVSRAARVLGLDRRSLQRKLAKRPPGR
jgi:two-component system response regulator RegA